MKTERWVWLTAAALAVAFWVWRAIVAQLPFYAFQSDPEVMYYDSAILLANGHALEHTDHPGTALQCTGALIARGLGLNLPSAFDPAAFRRFMLGWRLLALASLLGTGFWLAKRLAGRGAFGVALLPLLFAFDYQTLAYWLTFTPESAFFVLYLPVALWCLLRARGPGCSWRGGLGLAVLLGFATTIKLTLWPVTLFVLAQLALSRASSVPSWRRFAAYTGVAALVFAVAATVLAHDPMAPWRWVLGLIEHSGRYGAVRAEGGVFPPWSVGLEALRRAFALQAYTTLPVYAGILLLAIWSARRDPARDSRDRILGASFLAAFLLLLVMFLKHPYQGKYLMPASLLILLYATAQIESGPLPGLRWIRPLGVVLGLIVVNAVLSQKLLYDFAISRDQRVCAHIDAWLARVPHDAVVISSRLPHPIPAFREMARGPLLPLYFQHFGHIELTGTTSLDFQRVADPALPALPGVKRAIAFLNTPNPDARWVLVDANPSDALFVYLLK